MARVTKTWKQTALAATRGTRFGAIIKCVFGKTTGKDIPRFVGKAIVTSDGFVQCNFVSSDGAMRHGAFVGDVRDLEKNTADLIVHLELTDEEKKVFLGLMSQWIATDYRSKSQ